MIEDHPITSVETALRMIGRYAESNSIGGRELAWIFDVAPRVRIVVVPIEPRTRGRR
jgi:hypothetical protein